MMELGRIDDPRAALGFVDYLKSHGIECVMRSEDGVRVCVLTAPEHYHRAQPLWQEFLQNPYHDRYAGASWEVGQTNAPLRYRGRNLALGKRIMRLSFLNITVVALCSLVFLGFLLGGFNTLFGWMQFKADSPLQWITPAFVHFSVLHLLFNLLWWVMLGARIERACGRSMLWVLLFVTALCSNWAQFLMVGPNFGGLSGVVYGLVGFAWLYGVLRPNEPELIAKPMVGFMVFWLILGFVDVLFIPMANWAHLGGLFSGALVALFTVNKRGDQ